MAISHETRLLFSASVLTQDPSREVRMGLRSITNPILKQQDGIMNQNILGIGIAYYCLLLFVIACYCLLLPSGLLKVRAKYSFCFLFPNFPNTKHLGPQCSGLSTCGRCSAGCTLDNYRGVVNADKCKSDRQSNRHSNRQSNRQ